MIVLSVPPESSVQDVAALAEGSCEPEGETSQAIVEKMAQGAKGIDYEVEGRVKTLVTLPHYDPCSSVSSGSRRNRGSVEGTPSSAPFRGSKKSTRSSSTARDPPASEKAGNRSTQSCKAMSA